MTLPRTINQTGELVLGVVQRVELLKGILRPRSRAPTQRAVVVSLLKGFRTPPEIAKDIGVSVNAVNIALHHLHRHGLVRKVRRGVYEAEMDLLLLALLSLIDEIRERRMKR